MQNPKRILFIGGGSGGHIIPNLAIAFELKRLLPEAPLLYVGSRQPLDRTLAANAGLPFKSLFSGKLRRYFSWRNLIDPWLGLLGFFQSFYYLFSFWPHVVFTKGGFVSLPLVLAAWILRRPIILHESDSVMGLTNKITARFAKKVCLGFSNGTRLKSEILNLKQKFIFTGNPVRPFLKNGSAERGFNLTGFRRGKPVLLVWGGSQGSQEINQLIKTYFQDLQSHFQIIHVTGYGKSIQIHHAHYKAFPYLEEELPDIYAITDLVFGRAGANSLYELAFLQKPNLLLPLQSAAHHHQERNAEVFEKQGASLILRRPEDLVPLLLALAHNTAQQKAMKEALAQLARPRAAREIAELIVGMAD